MEEHIKSMEEESKDSIEETLIQDIEKFQDTIKELHTFKKQAEEVKKKTADDTSMTEEGNITAFMKMIKGDEK